MAGVKISNLPAIPSASFTDELAAVQGGTTYKVTLQEALDLINSSDNVRLATTGALNANYDNGTSGVGRTLTNNGALSALSIDSVSVSANDRILVKDQAAAEQNGIYVVTTVGDGSTAWVLTGASDFDEAAEIEQGDDFTVGAGTTNAKTQWIQTSVVSTVGTDSIDFESNVVAGDGISKSKNSLSINVASANSVLTSDNSSAVSWRGPMTDGQVLIGETGAVPKVATLTAGTGIGITNGAGTITINGTGSGFSWNEVTGTSQTMVVNNGYIANNAAQVDLTLPASANIGDHITVVGKGAGGWKISQNAGQTIHNNSTDTTTGTGGSIESTAQYNTVELVCITANTDWVVTDHEGSLTFT